jgi:putative flippase GtrA
VQHPFLAPGCVSFVAQCPACRMMRSVAQAESVTAQSSAGPGAAKRSTSRSLPRFLVTGALSFAVDVGTLFVAHGVLRIWLPLATTLAYAVAFTINFSLNRLWAFASTAAVGGQVGRYLALTAVNYVVTVAAVSGLAAAGLHYLVAKVITAAVIAAVNYIAYRLWVFR